MYIDNIKVDIIEYPYPFFSIETIDNIRLASKKDICAMKVNAIIGRGSRKDFYDLHQLLKEFSFEEIVAFYIEKYRIDNMNIMLRSLIYFNDADDENELNNKVISLLNENWESIKSNIEQKYDKAFFRYS